MAINLDLVSRARTIFWGFFFNFEIQYRLEAEEKSTRGYSDKLLDNGAMILGYFHNPPTFVPTTMQPDIAASTKVRPKPSVSPPSALIDGPMKIFAAAK